MVRRYNIRALIYALHALLIVKGTEHPCRPCYVVLIDT